MGLDVGVGLKLDGLQIAVEGSFQTPESWMVDEISLPYGPESIQIAGGANKEVIPKTADYPIQISDGKKEKTLTLTGTIAYDSATDQDLWAILSAIEDREGYEVILTCPIIALCRAYMLDSFSFSRNTKLLIYNYTLKLSLASQNVTIVGEYD